jgi:hypothetical protein
VAQARLRRQSGQSPVPVYLASKIFVSFGD